MKDGKILEYGTPEQIFAEREMLEECGLGLPSFYQYLHFLIGQDILSEEECEDIQDERALSKLLCKKYGKLKGRALSDDVEEDG